MRLLLIVVALSLSVAACGPPESAGTSSTGVTSIDGVTVRVELEGEPVVGLVPVSVRVEEGGTGVTGVSIDVIGEMTHAGMEPVIAQADQVEPGLYLADEFAFDMAGDWIVTAEVSMADGEMLRAMRALTVEQR